MNHAEIPYLHGSVARAGLIVSDGCAQEEAGTGDNRLDCSSFEQEITLSSHRKKTSHVSATVAVS